jgi:hypothetical protein
MTTSTRELIKKIKKIEKELKILKEPHSILGKMNVDETIIKHASQALFDFDIEKYVTKKDLKAWK